MTKIGLLADTHVPNRVAGLPPSLFERLAGVDLILHAGDLDAPFILDELAQIAPVQAVRGNWHLRSPWPNDQSLPLTLDLEIAGWRIIVTHGHLNLWNSFWEKNWLLWPNHRQHANQKLIKRLTRALPKADVYVFGHSHQALVERRNGALFVNPGAVCPTPGEAASVGLLRITTEGVTARIVPL